MSSAPPPAVLSVGLPELHFHPFDIFKRRTVQAPPLLLLRLPESVLISAGCHSSTRLPSCDCDFSNEGSELRWRKRRGRIPPAHLRRRQPITCANAPPVSLTPPFSGCNWLLMWKSILVGSGPLFAPQSCQNQCGIKTHAVLPERSGRVKKTKSKK